MPEQIFWIEEKLIFYQKSRFNIYGFSKCYFFRFDSSSIALSRSNASIPVDGGGFGALEVFAKCVLAVGDLDRPRFWRDFCGGGTFCGGNDGIAELNAFSPNRG